MIARVAAPAHEGRRWPEGSDAGAPLHRDRHGNPAELNDRFRGRLAVEGGALAGCSLRGPSDQGTIRSSRVGHPALAKLGRKAGLRDVGTATDVKAVLLALAMSVKLMRGSPGPLRGGVAR